MRNDRLPFAALCAASLLSASGCAPAADDAAATFDGPVAALVRRIAEARAVPRDLMIAIAHVEGGLTLPNVRDANPDELVQVAGVLELRHGRFDSLARGAALSGRSEEDLAAHLEAGTDAGAQVLDELAIAHGIDRTRLGAWAPVVEELSGHLHERARFDYRARVFSALRYGGSLPARDGERIELRPHDDVPLGLTLQPPPLRTQGMAEFPGAEWFDSPCTGKCDTDRGGNAVSMVVVHDTECGWDAAVATLQNDPGKSVHYLIDADGSRVGQFIPESYTGWHAGNYYYNQRSIGIEHVGFASKDDYQTGLYDKSAELVKSIVTRHAVPLDRRHVVGHQEVPNGKLIASSSPPCADSPESCVSNDDYGGANNHRDPGVYWEWCQYMEAVGGTCKCNDAHVIWNCVHDLSEVVRCENGTAKIQHCPTGCVVEPNGTDDHCAAEAGGAGETGGAGGGGHGGAGGASGTGGAMLTAAGGAGGGPPNGAHGGGAPTTAAPGDPMTTSNESGCALGRGEPSPSPAPLLAGLMLLGAAARKRRP